MSGSSSELSKTRLDGTCFLYIFMQLAGSKGHILYRIDTLAHLPCNNYNPSSPTNTMYDLQPLLVFPQPILPPECICVKLESNLYFFSGDMWKPTFGIKDAQKKDVLMIRESDLMDLQPSEHNTDVQKYFIRCVPMNEYKHMPTVFVAENKLYVLSTHHSDNQFEVYSPKLNAWHVLPPQPHSHRGVVDSYVVVGEIVYFKIRDYALLSFHLKEEKWGIMAPIPPVLPRHTFYSAHFQSPRPLVATLDMAFGFVYDEVDAVYDEDEDDNCLRRLTICATPLPNNKNFISQEFMLPSFSSDGDFSHALNSSRCPNVTNKSYMDFSDYIVSLDGGKVLCLISWGMGPELKDVHRSHDPYTGYATLNFFEVTPSRSPACSVNYASVNYASMKGDGKYVARTCFKAKLRKCSKAKHQHRKGHVLKVDYENEKADDGKYVAKRCFKAKLLHSAQFIIKTNNVPTIGRIDACLS